MKNVKLPISKKSSSLYLSGHLHFAEYCNNQGDNGHQQAYAAKAKNNPKLQHAEGHNAVFDSSRNNTLLYKV